MMDNADEMMDKAISMKLFEVEKRLKSGYRVTITCNCVKERFSAFQIVSIGKTISTSTTEILIMNDKVVNAEVFDYELSWIHDVEVEHGFLKFKANEVNNKFTIPLVDNYTKYFKDRENKYSGFSVFVQKVKFDKLEFV